MKKNYATGLKSWWRRLLLGTCRLMFSSLIWGSSIEPATPRDWTHMSVVSTLGHVHTGPGATASTSPSHPHFSITFGERVFVSLRQRKIFWWTVTIDMLSKESAKHSTMKGKYVPKKRHPGQCARRNWGAKIKPARRQPPQSGCPGPAPAPAVLSSRPPLLQFPLSTVIILLLHHLHLLSG